MRPEILLCTSHGKGGSEMGIKQHSTVKKEGEKKKVADNILMSHKEPPVPTGAPVEPQGFS